MTPDERSHLVDELEQVAEEYRYRDNMLVTESSISTAAIGILLTVIWVPVSDAPTPGLIVLQVAGAFYLGLLTWHMSQCITDRDAALARSAAIRKDLGFVEFHG